MTDSADITELEKKFPRIVEKISLLWGHGDISAFLSHLLIDERGDRQGFTSDIMSEIMFLNNLHEDITNADRVLSGQALWENPLVKNLQT